MDSHEDLYESEAGAGEMLLSQCPRCGQLVVDTEFGVVCASYNAGAGW